MNSIVVNKIKIISSKVKTLLESDQKYRDSDEALVVKIWCEEINKNSEMTLIDFFQNYAAGKLTTSDTITRARRKVQEEFTELRGKSWHGRKEEEAQVKLEINKI